MFEEMILEQKKVRKKYVNGKKGHGEIVSIEVKNNKIVFVRGGEKSFRTKQYVKLIENTTETRFIKNCFINININDVPREGYFNFSREIGKASQFLLPNHRFTIDDLMIDYENTRTETFNEQIALIKTLSMPYDSKIKKIFTSCLPQVNKIDYFKYALNNQFCDGYLWIGSVHGKIKADDELINELQKKNMVGLPFIPFMRHGDYKYILYNDGFSLSDRMRLLLCLNSIIIRKVSPFEEFYTYKLKPDVNFIEYNDNEELLGIFNRLEQDTDLCDHIIGNNRAFVEDVLNYQNILQYTADVINAVC